MQNNPGSTADYLAEMAYHLARMARRTDLRVSWFLFDMAFLDAAENYQRLTAGRISERQRSRGGGPHGSDANSFTTCDSVREILGIDFTSRHLAPLTGGGGDCPGALDCPSGVGARDIQ